MRMLKLQWSDIFPSGSGRLGRKDYFVALFKLGAAYFISVKIFSVLLTAAMRQSGFEAPANAFDAPLAAAFMQLTFIWPVMALASRRMADIKQSLRERYWFWRYAFPAALVTFAGANALTAVGLERFVDMHSISFLGPLTGYILIMAGFLSPEPQGGGQRMTSPAPAAWQAFAELARTIAAKPAELPLKAQAQAAARTGADASARPAPAPPPVSQVLVRTRSLPEQGRAKTGWFS